MFKKTIAKFLTAAMVMTSIGAAVPVNAAEANTVTALHANRNNIYLTMSQDNYSEWSMPTATLTEYDKNGVSKEIETEEVAFTDIENSEKDITVTPKTALSLDKIYKLELKTDEETVTQYFDYKILTEVTDYSSQNAIMAKIARPQNNWTAKNNKMRMYSAYAFPMQPTLANANLDDWTDYTVEFKYYDNESFKDSKASDIPAGSTEIMRGSILPQLSFYISPTAKPNDIFTERLNNMPGFFGITLVKNTSTVETKGTSDKGSGTVGFMLRPDNDMVRYIAKETENESTVYTAITTKWTSTTDGIASYVGKDILVSASAFGDNLYATVTNTANGDRLFTGEATIDKSALVRDKGVFAVGINNQVIYTDSTSTKQYKDGCALVDGIVAYKAELISTDYAAEQTITPHGTKDKLIFKFGENVINAAATVTDLSGNTIEVASNSYANKELVTRLNEKLDLDKFYYVTVKWGLSLEHEKTLLIGYDVLFEEDFETITTDSMGSKWRTRGGSSIVDGKFQNNNQSYAVYLQDAYVENEQNWKDYTVEYEFKKQNAQDVELTEARLGVMFYIRKQGNYAMNTGADVKNFGAVLASNWVNYYDTDKQELQKNENSLPKTYTEDVVYSASLFDKDAYTSVYSAANGTLIAENEIKLANINSELTYGKFGFMTWVLPENRLIGYKWTDTDGNEQTAATEPSSENVKEDTTVTKVYENIQSWIDNIVAYKLKTIEAPTYTDAETFTLDANKEAVVAVFNTDIIDAEVEITEIGKTAKVEGITTTYNSERKTVTATLANKLDLNKKYTVTVKYGLECEKSVSKDIGFKVLFSDDFDDYASVEDSYSKAKWRNLDSAHVGKASDGSCLPGIENGKLTIKNAEWAVYGIFTNPALENDDWNHYTVEFDVKIENNEANTEQYAGIPTYMYTDTDQDYVSLNINQRAYQVDPTRAYSTDSTKNQLFAYKPVSDIMIDTYGDKLAVAYNHTVGQDTKGDNTIVSMYSRTNNVADKELKGKDVTVSFGHIGDYFMSNIKENNTADGIWKENLTYIGTDLRHGKGGFAIGGGEKYATVDNVIAYKMYAVDGFDVSCSTIEATADGAKLDVELINADNTDNKVVLALYGDYGKFLGAAEKTANSNTITVTGVTAADVKTAALMSFDSYGSLTPIIFKVKAD